VIFAHLKRIQTLSATFSHFDSDIYPPKKLHAHIV